MFTREDRLGMDFVQEAVRRKNDILPELREIVSDKKNYKKSSKGRWGVIHAVRLIGLLADEKGVGPLMDASLLSLDYDIDWIWEALPECFSRIGPVALPLLTDHLRYETYPDHFLTILTAVWNIYERYPDTRDGIEMSLIDLLKNFRIYPEATGYLVYGLSSIGRRDLKPFFDALFDSGEIDLNLIGPENIDQLFNRHKIPSFFIDIESFYSENAIRERQERWAQLDIEDRAKEYLKYLITHESEIGRNNPCPCGSGKKFKKCCLAMVEQAKQEIAATRKEIGEKRELRDAHHVMRSSEMALRQILAEYNRTDIFTEIKHSLHAILDARLDTIQERGFGSFVSPILDNTTFLNKKETKRFFELLSDYWSAASYIMSRTEEPSNTEPKP